MKPHAYMWSCDDPVCDCTQPRISFGGASPEIEGPFHSEAMPSETVEQWNWLVEQAVAHNCDAENIAFVREMRDRAVLGAVDSGN